MAVARLDRAVVAPAGKSLVLFVTDLQGNPSKLSGITTAPTISVNGGPALALVNPIFSKGNPRSWVLYPLTGTSGVLQAPLSPTDSVVVSVVDSWATSAAGSVGQGTVTATYAQSSLIPPFEVGPKTMRVGYNIGNSAVWLPMTFSNLARMSRSWEARTVDISTGWNHKWDGDVTVNSTGYPVSLNSGNEVWAGFAQNLGVDITPGEGIYTVQYRSKSNDCSVIVGDYYSFTEWGPPVVTKLSDGRVRVQRHVKHPSGISPPLAIGIFKSADPVNDPWGDKGKVYGPYPIDIEELEIYPPHIDPDDPPLFDPVYIRQAAPATCLRFMDCLNGGWSNFVAKEDFYDRFTRLSCDDSAGLVLGGSVVSISTYDNSDGFYDVSGITNVPILFEFAEPHGMREGQNFSLSGFVGPNGNGTFPLTGGHYLGEGGHNAGDPAPGGLMTSLGDGFIANIHIVSPTKVATTSASVDYVVGAMLDGTFTTATNLGDKAKATVKTQTGWDPVDCIIMSNTVGADAWISAPYNGTDETFAWLFDLIAKSLRADLKCYVELGDETWNWGFQSAQWALTQGKVQKPPLNNDQWTVKRSGEMWEIAEEAFAAAGRPKSDVVRVLGTQVEWDWISRVRLQYAVDNHIRVDVLAGAPYFENEPSDPALGVIYDSMDQDQLMDLGEVSMGYENSSIDWVHQTQVVLNSLAPSVQHVCYEGGPADGALTTALSSTDLALRSRKWGYDPRMRGIFLSYLQQLQDAGCTLYVDFMLNGPGGRNPWSCYTYWNERSGLGDGSDGLADNHKVDPTYTMNFVSVVSGAIEYWNSLVKPTKTREELGVERRRGVRRSRRRQAI